MLIAAYPSGVHEPAPLFPFWRPTNDGLTHYSDLRALVGDAGSLDTAYAATYGGGVYKSTNAGRVWSSANQGLSSSNVLALLANGTRPGSIFAGTEDGLFRSDDRAATWTRDVPELTGATVHTLRATPTVERMFAGTNKGGFVATCR